jgi:lipopolysaccharide biosynthesis glycosyltransferase
MKDIVRVFLGYDSNESVALYTLMHSIVSRASRPVAITPIVLKQVPLSRPKAEFQSTEFSFSRFLVPWMCGFEGKAIFMDSDIICMADICELWDLPLDRTVSVVKHDYRPNMENKFLNQPQSTYPKKNWSSVMVFNNPLCKALTPTMVNTASGAYLHQFQWVEYGDVEAYSMIGELPREWNHLVGEENQGRIEDAKLIHYTRGTPCFAKYRQCEGSILWHGELAKMTYHNPVGEFSHEKAPEICGVPV